MITLNSPGIGERVAYVVKRGIAHEKICERAEDPVFFVANNMEIDPEYYVKKLQKGVTKMLNLIFTTDKPVRRLGFLGYMEQSGASITESLFAKQRHQMPVNKQMAR